MNYQYIEIKAYDKYCFLVLNRPEKRNALNRVMREELLDFFGGEAEKFDIVVLIGKGKGFCAGMDLREQGLAEGAAHFMKVPKAVYDSKCIVLAAVNGAARGGGLMIINACDLAIASEVSTFGMPNISSSGDPAFADPKIQQAIREKADKYLALAGKSIGADAAKDFGLLNEVVPHDALWEQAETMAMHLLEVGVVTLQAHKKELNQIPFNNSLRVKREGLAQRI